MRRMNLFVRWIRNAFRSQWFPWSIVGITLLSVLVIEVLQLTWIESLSGVGQALFWLLVLLGLVLIYLTVSRFVELYDQRERLEIRLSDSEKLITDAYQRLEAVFQVSQKFVEASDENEVVEPVLRLLVDLTGAEGVSFVPLDEHGQPQAAVNHGHLPFPVMEAWLEYLASPGVRERCRSCTNPEALDKPASCPLFKAPFSGSVQLFCLPVWRREREFGVVTLFLPESSSLIDERTRIYLRALIDQTALGLEGLHLRRRELDALRQMQSLRQKTDLAGLLGSLLENVHRTMESDFAGMVVPSITVDRAQPARNRGKTAAPHFDLSRGHIPAHAQPFLDGIVQGVMVSGEPVLLGDVSGDPLADKNTVTSLRSLIAAPLLSSGGLYSPGEPAQTDRLVLGVLVCANGGAGNKHSRSFHQRQLALLQTIAGQVALIIQNANLVAELEYNVMMQERTRLAREIHDGLAQTLGFLKLQAAQIRAYLGRGEVDRLRQNIDLYYTTLSEAYQDARQSIDGLRISPAECGLQGWLEQTVNEFQEVSGIQVSLRVDDHLMELLDSVDFPSEVHAQLIRIVQEALSNVRKHSQASRVWVSCMQADGEMVLEIRDDGQGFAPEDVAVPSRHGLRGMRERADLIEADIQLISHPGDGTIVRVSLPVEKDHAVLPFSPMDKNPSLDSAANIKGELMG
jgi:two-component system nitrate/nitrite sensor histidine kinase NarX